MQGDSWISRLFKKKPQQNQTSSLSKPSIWQLPWSPAGKNPHTSFAQRLPDLRKVQLKSLYKDGNRFSKYLTQMVAIHSSLHLNAYRIEHWKLMSFPKTEFSCTVSNMVMSAIRLICHIFLKKGILLGTCITVYWTRIFILLCLWEMEKKLSLTYK